MTSTGDIDLRDRLTGLLLGTAVGDAIGLPREGLPPARARRRFGPELRNALVLGRGMVSDDTEHALLVGQALLRSGAEPAGFSRALASGLRRWFAGLPPALGWATLRAMVRLSVGLRAERSGVWSAGNGPTMRAPILGACLHRDDARRIALVRTATRVTHTDPRAEEGAQVIALAAARAVAARPGTLDPDALLAELRSGVTGKELRRSLAAVRCALSGGPPADPPDLGFDLRRGVSGYVNQTVPAVLYAWLRSPDDVRQAVTTVVELGGDTDTTGALVGALAGATAGEAGIPADWRDGLWEWPRGAAWIRCLGGRLAAAFAHGGETAPGPPLRWAWPVLPLRNLVFTVIVLVQGFRRLLPL